MTAIIATAIAFLFVGFVVGAVCSTASHLPDSANDEKDCAPPNLTVVEWHDNKARKGGADTGYIWILNVKHPHHLDMVVDLALTEEDWERTFDRACKNAEDIPGRDLG